MKASFYINNEFIEAFTFNPDDIGMLTTTELPKHSIITNDGSYIESIIYHMIADDMTAGDEVIYPSAVYETSGDLKIKLTNN